MKFCMSPKISNMSGGCFSKLDASKILHHPKTNPAWNLGYAHHIIRPSLGSAAICEGFVDANYQ